jgi:hypothetical protein
MSDVAPEETSEVVNLLRAGNFKEALLRLAELEAIRPLTARELLEKGRAVLLGQGDEGYPLSAAKEAFLASHRLCSDAIEPLLELGWYYAAVEDDCARARPIFEECVSRARVLLTEAAHGLGMCQEELESSDEAARALRAVHRAALNVQALPEEQRVWLGED